jgi:tRNA (cytidine/uridine-2'-O-)-methyltransferase
MDRLLAFMDEPQLHVVLHQPEIPQNTGNIGRTCVGAGAKLWLVRPLGFRLDDHHVRRAGLDYWQYLDWEATAHWPELVERLPARKWFFTKHAQKSYTDATFLPGDALVFGSETSGLPKSMLTSGEEHCVKIPTQPQIRSLNLSCSVAIGLFEALRQLSLS